MNTYYVVGSRTLTDPTGKAYEVQDVQGHFDAPSVKDLRAAAAKAGIRLVRVVNVSAKWARQERGYERARA